MSFQALVGRYGPSYCLPWAGAGEGDWEWAGLKDWGFQASCSHLAAEALRAGQDGSSQACSMHTGHQVHVVSRSQVASAAFGTKLPLLFTRQGSSVNLVF